MSTIKDILAAYKVSAEKLGTTPPCAVGIDVSQWQGSIDWKKAKSEIDFAIIRAGAGIGIDTMATINVKECEKNNIPYGIYWFSYAFNVAGAIDEADRVCDFADQCAPSYPIVFDWEEDSMRYAKNRGIDLTAAQICEIAKAFMNRVESRGYLPMLYANLSFINAFYSKDPYFEKHELWYAFWSNNTPARSCGMWQKSSAAKCAGIHGDVDLDLCYKDYPAIIKKLNKTQSKNKKEQEIKDAIIGRYTSLAVEIVRGVYGNGDERKEKLLDLGYDYSYAQSVVDASILPDKSIADVHKDYYRKYKDIAEMANKGYYGTPDMRKYVFKALGYDQVIIDYINTL